VQFLETRDIRFIVGVIKLKAALRLEFNISMSFKHNEISSLFVEFGKYVFPKLNFEVSWSEKHDFLHKLPRVYLFGINKL